MIEKIDEYLQEIKSFETQSPEELEKFRIRFLGSKGLIKELFGESVDSMAYINTWYQSPLKTSRNGYENARTNINLDGKSALHCWNSKKQLQSYPEDWSALSVSPRMWVKQLYVLGKECGLILEFPDVYVEQSSTHALF